MIPSKLAVVVHIYYLELWEEIIDYLQKIESPFDLFITTTLDQEKKVCGEVQNIFPSAHIRAYPNIGMDCVPFLHLIPELAESNYLAICKLHTKKGDGKLGSVWRKALLQSLVGSNKTIQRVSQGFSTHNNLAMVGTGAFYLSAQKVRQADNTTCLQRLYDALAISSPLNDWGFFAGSMFWVKPETLMPLALVVNENPDWFHTAIKRDGRMEHALERMMGLSSLQTQRTVAHLLPAIGSKLDFVLQVMDAELAQKQIGQAYISPLLHQYQTLLKDRTELLKAGFFSYSGYLKQFPTLSGLHADLLSHYLLIGRFQGASPHSNIGKKTLINDVNSLSKEKIICCENPKYHPDLFWLKANKTNSKLLIISWINSSSQLKSITSFFDEINVFYDIVFIMPRELAITCKFNYHSDINEHVFFIGFPSQTKKCGAFIRVINTHILEKYKSLLWVDSQKIKNIDMPSASAFISNINANSGIVSDGFIKNNFNKISGKYFGTWLPRIQQKKPTEDFFFPSGSFMIKTNIINQLLGMTICPSVFDNIHDAEDEKSFNTLLALFGYFSKQGKYDNYTISDFNEKKKQHGNHILNNDRCVKTIAFFLPQFHIIPENNQWWGKGFTEWNNVVGAKPLFRNHYQPKLPSDLGFYDLLSQKTQVSQAELASNYNIHGFCYYYYWFNGKKVLNEPIEKMLQSGKPDFPFCVCWANENWSRNWDGQNKDVLLEQNYTVESNRALIHEFIGMMKDERYIRHHGKPVLLVYRIKIIPNWLRVATMWRQECRKAGIGEIHLCSIQFGLEPLKGMPSKHGLDAYVLFPPQDTNFVDAKNSVLDLKTDFNGSIFSYNEVVKGDIERFKSGYPYPVHRGAMLGWDNTARRSNSARVFVGCTPMVYRSWIKKILEQEEKYNSDEESLFFINAWNEWAEGTTLEPDQRYGTSYLEATKSVLEKYEGGVEKNSDVKIITNKKINDSIKFIKELRKPELPKWFKGNVEHKENMPTVLLCAHISGQYLFGGERSFLDVLNALYRIGFNIIVTLPSDNNSEYIELICSQALGVYTFHYPQWVADRDTDNFLVLTFCNIIATHDVSIVYSNTIVIPESSIAARYMNRISIVHVRELITFDDDLREAIGLPVQEIIKRVLRSNDFLVANSRATELAFAREGRTFYAPNVVDATDLSMINKIDSRVKIGIVSSNIPKKGIADFIEVAKLCQDISSISEFVIIGPDNNYTVAWKKQIKEGKLPSNIKFLGYRNSPKEAMAELNILLNLSSFAESFGRTVAEAMAANRPVIAYQWGALSELVKHDKTGFLVSFGDVSGVAFYIRKLCKERLLIDEMGKAGHTLMSTYFSHDTLYQRLNKAYDKIKTSIQWNNLGYAKNLVSRNAIQATIIIPVYNAPNEVKNCIDSVIRNTSLTDFKVLIINDGSRDRKVDKVLKLYDNISGVHVISNDKNIGYTKTINRGIIEAGNDDVILLNSDTIVTPCWAMAMRSSAYREDKIGTVTAMSDNAGAFSFPEQGISNAKPSNLTHDEYAMRIVDSAIDCQFVDVPTGSGFCMYIQRRLIDNIGLFDEKLFPRGYGEENDFCMRVNKIGWRNIITPWVFIYHVRTASFKGEKEKLVKEGVDVVTKKYPDYAKKVKIAFSSSEILTLRSRIREI